MEVILKSVKSLKRMTNNMIMLLSSTHFCIKSFIYQINFYSILGIGVEASFSMTNTDLRTSSMALDRAGNSITFFSLSEEIFNVSMNKSNLEVPTKIKTPLLWTYSKQKQHPIEKPHSRLASHERLQYHVFRKLSKQDQAWCRAKPEVSEGPQAMAHLFVGRSK